MSTRAEEQANHRLHYHFPTPETPSFSFSISAVHDGGLLQAAKTTWAISHHQTLGYFSLAIRGWLGSKDRTVVVAVVGRVLAAFPPSPCRVTLHVSSRHALRST